MKKNYANKIEGIKKRIDSISDAIFYYRPGFELISMLYGLGRALDNLYDSVKHDLLREIYK